MLQQAEQTELDLGMEPLVNPEWPPGLTHAETYALWIAANPWVLGAAERITAHIVETGQHRVSMKEVWERMRRAYTARFAKTPAAKTFHANNNYTAYLARDILARRPEWAERGVIRTRRTRA